MRHTEVGHAWRRWVLLMLAVAVSGAAVLGGRLQASSGSLTPPDSSADTVVLTGAYTCSVFSYSLPAPYPGPEEPPPEPVIVRELSHGIGIAGTGAINAPIPREPGPVFGGRTGVTVEPLNLGSGISTGFDGGTLEDCVRFGEAMATVAAGLGCVTSPMRTRQGVSIVNAEARFSFVCEGQASSQIHAIGELDRAVLAQRLASAP